VSTMIGEIVLELFFAAIGIIFLINAFQIEVLSLGFFGPRLFPILISTLLIVLSSILLVKTLRKVIKYRSILTLSNVDIKSKIKDIRYPLVLIFLIILDIYLVNIIGYLLALMILIGILSKLLGAKNSEAILLAISFSMLIFVLFRLLLKVPLPEGVLGW